MFVGVLVVVYVLGGATPEVQVDRLGIYEMTDCEERAKRRTDTQPPETVHRSGAVILSRSYDCVLFDREEMVDALAALPAS